MYRLSYLQSRLRDSKSARPKQRRILQAAIEVLETRVLLSGQKPIPTLNFDYAASFPLGFNPSGGLQLESLKKNETGNLDIVAAGDGAVNVLLGNGDGTFGPAISTPVAGTGYLKMAVGNSNSDGSTQMIDVNGDGIPDIVTVRCANLVAGKPAYDGTVTVLLGNGNGTFSREVYNLGPYGPEAYSVAVGDLGNVAISGPHIGQPTQDIVVTNKYNRTVTVLLGNGNGTFKLPTAANVFDVGNQPTHVAIGDINGDGIPDIVVRNEADDSISILLGNGDGTFQPQFVFRLHESAGVVNATDFVLADLSGDNFDTGGPIYDIVAHGVALINNLPDTGGNFSSNPFTQVGAGNGGSITFGKVNVDGDGFDRVTPSNYDGSGYEHDYNTVNVELSNQNGTFGPAVRTYSTVSRYTEYVAGKAVSNTVNPDSGTLMGYDPNEAAIGDINGDGLPDLIVTSHGGGADNAPPAVTVFLATANATFLGQRVTTVGAGVDTKGFANSTSVVATNPYPNAMAVGDINGDGLPDVIVASYGTAPAAGTPPTISNYPGSITVLLNNGDGRFLVSQTIRDGYGPDAVAIADLNGDGKPDLIVANHYNGNVEVFEGYGNGKFSKNPVTTTYAGNHPVSLSVADFNGDGKPDIVVADYGVPYASMTAPGTPGAVVLLTNSNNFALSESHILTDDYGPSAVIATDYAGNTLDLNGDGHADIAVTNKLTDKEGSIGPVTGPDGNTVVILLGNGDGSFKAPQYVDVGIGPNALVAGHFNGSANPLGIAVLNESVDSLTLLAGNGTGPHGDGQFSVQQAYNFNFVSNDPGPSESDSSPIGLTAVNLAGDGYDDVVLTYGGTNNNPGSTIGLMLDQNNSGKGKLLKPELYTVSSQVIGFGLPHQVETPLHTLPVLVDFTDVNGDGLPDLVVLNSNQQYYLGEVTTLLLSQQPMAPTITSTNTFTFAAGTFGSANILTGTATFPTAQLSDSSDALLASLGLTFDNNQNGTATISGTPLAISSGSSTHTLTITATNGYYPDATQNVTIDIDQPPIITTSPTATFTVGNTGTFVVRTVGLPTASITSSALPTWLHLTDNGNGTATLSGAPPSGAGGIVNFTITAQDGLAPSDIQPFILTVDQAPTLTSGGTATFYTGAFGTFSITTLGSTFPVASLGETGALPSGLSFLDEGNGTATIFGTPSANAAGIYSIPLTVGNGVSVINPTLTLIVDESPTFNSSATQTLTVGTAGTVTITTTATPAATITEEGSLPTGLTFTPDPANGTATITGTPAAGSGGQYALTLTAANGVLPGGAQTLTLDIDAAPVITTTTATFVVDAFSTTLVSTSGFPAATLGETGTLPAGLSFTANSNGTAFISGTAAPGSGGEYTVTLSAANGIAPNASQTFTINVDQAPAITSADVATFFTGTAGSFTIATSGFPAATLGETGALPAGLTFTPNGNGTATISGTPQTTAQGTYSLTINATNGISPDAAQTFTLSVIGPVSITNVAGVVTGTGTLSADTATISVNGTNLFVQIDQVSATFPLSTVNTINFSLGDGPDSITIAAGVPAVFVDGGNGADTIIASNSAADTLSGGDGNDSIRAGGGNEVLSGGLGNDTLVAGDGNDTLGGGLDTDSLIGGSGADLLNGGQGADTLVAGVGSGNNTLNGGRGHDSLVATGTMPVLINGGMGSDTIVASSIDTILGGTGDSILSST
jgi:FG-GAP-like repeat/RTX calcium-binding nonapeptide repeat (4 copies)/Putative Ig domain